tara:strand:- start:107 stop:343 length:237 start_codon:yes stop_codon:yes gene_type:complete
VGKTTSSLYKLWGRRINMKEEDIIKKAKMHKVGIVDCVKQIIAINQELADIESRDDGHMMFIVQLRDRIERLEKKLLN